MAFGIFLIIQINPISNPQNNISLGKSFNFNQKNNLI